MKALGQKVPALTAYDYPMAQLLDAAGIPLLLVGDSLGMVVLGYPDTTHVTMAEMEHHVRAVARAKPLALVAADLPYGSYETPEAAVANAQRLLVAGAEAVKAEGGQRIRPQIEAIIAAGIPFLGHLGMLPQSILLEGAYRVKGKLEAEQQTLMADVALLGSLGAFAIVLELVSAPLARQLTAQSVIPTIGIGSGSGCDGQILVVTDLLGTSPGPIPRHVTQRLNFAEQAGQMIKQWKQSVLGSTP